MKKLCGLLLLLCLTGCMAKSILAKDSVVIFSHGSNEAGYRMPFYQTLKGKFEEKGYIVYMFDYTGFGEAPDPVDIEKAESYHFKEDLEKAINEVYLRYNPEEVILIGHSFGASPTLAVGADNPYVDKVICIAPPRRMKELFFSEQPKRGLEWLQQRIKDDMELDRYPPKDILWDIHKEIILENFEGYQFNKPVLFIDEGSATVEDLDFMIRLCKSTKGNVLHMFIPDTDHYFGNSTDRLVDLIDKWIK